MTYTCKKWITIKNLLYSMGSGGKTLSMEHILFTFKMHSNIHYVQTSAIWFYLYKIPRIVKFIESESTLVDARGQGWG